MRARAAQQDGPTRRTKRSTRRSAPRTARTERPQMGSARCGLPTVGKAGVMGLFVGGHRPDGN
eukprot:8043506-Alexandrium_andersonii.AAC.1